MSHHWLQVVNDHYSGWGDQQLVDDLFTFFCTNGTTKRLWKQLADQVYKAFLDTGNTLSIVARTLLKQAKIRKTKTVARRGWENHPLPGGG